MGRWDSVRRGPQFLRDGGKVVGVVVLVHVAVKREEPAEEKRGAGQAEHQRAIDPVIFPVPAEHADYNMGSEAACGHDLQQDHPT